jgi:hypothetical protein
MKGEDMDLDMLRLIMRDAPNPAESLGLIEKPRPRFFIPSTRKTKSDLPQKNWKARKKRNKVARASRKRNR